MGRYSKSTFPLSVKRKEPARRLAEEQLAEPKEDPIAGPQAN